MIIKNYHIPSGYIKPESEPIANNLQIIEDVTDVLVYAGCVDYQSARGNAENGYGPTCFYGSENFPVKKFVRHIDFTRHNIRCRLVVTDHAYVCNDDGKTVEKVSCG